MTRPTLPLPPSLQAFRVVAVVRLVVVAVSLVAAAVVVPRTFDDVSRGVFATRTGDPTVPRVDLSGLGPIVAVVTVVFGAAFLAGWAFCAWRVTTTGRKWAAITTGALSAYAVVSGLLSIGVLFLERLAPRTFVPRLPGWYLAVAGLAAAVDLVVVVLLVLPASRAWFRAVNPAPPRPPAPGPYGYGPPAPGRRH